VVNVNSSIFEMSHILVLWEQPGRHPSSKKYFSMVIFYSAFLQKFGEKLVRGFQVNCSVPFA